MDKFITWLQGNKKIVLMAVTVLLAIASMIFPKFNVTTLIDNIQLMSGKVDSIVESTETTTTTTTTTDPAPAPTKTP